MAEITVVLTNFRRPRNMSRILEALEAQTCRPQVFVWDNSTDGSFDDSRAGWLVRSSRNAMCGARWWLASQAATEWVAVLDDDLCPRDPSVLDDTLDALHAHYPRPVGAFGVVLRPGIPYAACRHLVAGSVEQTVDVLKGRYFAVHVARLQELRHVPLGCEDDIAVSAALGPGALPACLANRFEELPTGNEAWQLRPQHLARRESARRRFFRDR